MKEQSENNDLNKKFEDFAYPVGATNWDSIAAGIPTGSGDGFLSEKFANYSVSPSSAVWSGIRAVIAPSSRKRLAVWWWYGAAAAVVLFGYFAFTQINSVENQGQTVQQKIQSKNAVESNAESNSNDQNSVTNQVEKSKFASSSASAKANTATEENETNSIAESNKTGAENGDAIMEKISNQGSSKNVFKTSKNNQNIANPLAAVDAAQDRKRNLNMVALNTDESTYVINNEGLTKLDPIKSAISKSLIAAELAGELRPAPFAESETEKSKKKSSPFYDGTETTSNNEISLLAGSQLAFANTSENNSADFTFNSITTGSIEDLALPSISYSTPIYYGVNGEIKFWKRLSAGIGLGYLRMNKSSSFYYNSQERLEENNAKAYLSVPVYLKFSFIDKPKFATYISAGHAYDFLIWQKSSRDSYVNETLVESFEMEKEKGNQANVFTSLGMQFKFTPHIGVFTEGTLMRYYSLSSDNFYSQENFWPGLKFGVLVSF